MLVHRYMYTLRFCYLTLTFATPIFCAILLGPVTASCLIVEKGYRLTVNIELLYNEQCSQRYQT